MKLVFVLGPTASGKSALAARLAHQHAGAVFNCDSIQVYEGLKIGAAQPEPEELMLAPHYLYGFIAKGETLTAGEFRKHFLAKLEELKSSYPVIFVAGGAGFYLQAIEKGMFATSAADPEITKQLESELEQRGPTSLHAELSQLDPESGQKISVNDHYRLVRALGIIRQTGKKPSELRKNIETTKLPYPYIKIGLQLSKEELMQRIGQRTQTMLGRGLLKEVQELLAGGYGEWSALRSVGYKEAVEFLRSKATDENKLSEQIQQATLRLTKKQKTWFKRDKDIHWFHPEQLASIEEFTAKFLAQKLSKRP